MDIRRANDEDREHATALLEAAGLPPLPRALPLANVLLALDESAAVGVVALEVSARSGLLRAIAVREERRRQGVAHSLVRALQARVNELGLRDVYALATEGSQGFFEKMGFSAVPREQAPPEIRRMPVFRERCPDATLLRLPLATRF